MVTEKGRKEIELEWNGQKGKFLLVADLTAGQLQPMIKNCVRLDSESGLGLDSFNNEEWVIQMSQKLIKETPPGFAIDKPDNFRNLDPDVWGQLEDFIGDYYPIMTFLSRYLKMILGKKLPPLNLKLPTGSTLSVSDGSDGQKPK